MKEKDNKQEKEHKPIISDKAFTIFLIISFLLLILIFFMNFKHSVEMKGVEAQRDYYKNQMLNFCELAELRVNPNEDIWMAPCKSWVIG